MSIGDSKIRELVRNKFGGKCAYCGGVISKLHIDHVEPRRRYLLDPRHTFFGSKEVCGENHIDNYYPSCQSCNSSKGSANIEQFRKQIAGRHEYMMQYSSEYRSMIKFHRITINTNPVKFFFETYK